MKCQNCNNEFIIDEQDKAFYNKISVPEPTFCPECRLKRRFIWRNEHVLYKRKDFKTGEMIFSTIPESAPVKVYEREYWWSDEWDPMEYGMDIDWDKPFLQQIKELSADVPYFSRSVIRLINSEYSANCGDLKNCYMVFHANDNENCSYCINIQHSKDSIDNYGLFKGELCYQCFMVHNSYRAFYSLHCSNCQNIYFSYNLVNCQDCFACINLRSKQYYIFNKPYSKEEYEKKLKEFDIGSFKNKEEIEKKARDFWLQFPYKFIHGIKNINVKGDYLDYCKNVKDSFLVEQSEDCRYCSNLGLGGVKDSYDYSIWGQSAELIYETTQVGIGASRIKFSNFSYPDCHDMEYCMRCHSSSNLFGCIGLKKKQYCILNKQYTKEEYTSLIPKIKKHMMDMPYTDARGIIYRYGEYFPVEFSPFAYNETIAQEYFPLTKEQAIEQGYTWKDPEEKDIQGITNLPDHIKDADEGILKEIIQCEHNSDQCSKAFRIISQELEFYKKYNLPLPRLCPNCRHSQRFKQMNPLKLYKRKCNKCPNEFETTYASHRPEIVYCEECYQKEVN